MSAKFSAGVLALVVLLGTAETSYGWPDPPVAILSAEPEYTLADVDVLFDGSDSYDPDGSITKYEWDFDYNGVAFDPCYYETSSYHPDGAFDGNTTWSYSQAGSYTVMLRVTDNNELTDTDMCQVYVNFKISVPEDVASIQEAINGADPCGNTTITVSVGTYYEAIDINVPCVLTGTNPDDALVVAATIIDGNGADHSVMFTSSEHANSVLTGFTITGGKADGSGEGKYGGGIYCSGASPTISNCVIRDNVVDTSWGGGAGMYIHNCSPKVRNCVFWANTCNYAFDYAGGIYNADASPTVTNCIFAENTGFFGGAIVNYGSSSCPTITNCTLTANFAYAGGGGVYNWSSHPNLNNCILWGDETLGGDFEEVYNSGPADPNFRYCDIKGCGGSGGGWDPNFGTDGGGNIDKDPNFMDGGDPCGPDGVFCTGDDGLYLETGLNDSPCLDAADGNSAPSTDITGQVRVDVNDVNNTGSGDPNYADMGAYESPMIWFVDKDASGSNNGMSWEDAFCDLQKALAEANDGHEIWVAEGTYKPTDGNDRSISFELMENLEVYGGFAGTETRRNQRDWTTYETILSGDIHEPNDASDNTHNVVMAVETNNAVLDGFTITGGNADAAGIGYAGGGIYCAGATMTVANCTLSNNAAMWAGGMYIEDCSPTVTNCVFVENTCPWDGGAICYANGAPTVTDCAFYWNTAGGYGGGIANYGSSGVVSDCTFKGNVAAYNGGGIFNYNIPSTHTTTNSVFVDNDAPNGGGMYNNSCSVTVTSCVFTGNIADYGGGMQNGGVSATVTNCTFFENDANNQGGGIQTYGGSVVTVTNCICWGNDASTGGEVYNSYSDVTFSYSDIEGGLNGSKFGGGSCSDGGGNIDSDPCFTDANDPAGPDSVLGTLDDGLRLTIDSNCIDAADGSAAPATDIIGLGREDIDDVENTGTGDPNYTDMGYYEFGHDYDGDGMHDEWEVEFGLDPTDPGDAGQDADDDGLTNLGEYNAGTDPTDWDSDDDNLPDGWEDQYDFNPLDPGDADQDADTDGYNNLSEYLHGTNPKNSGSTPTAIITIAVPDDVNCIQRALDASIDGDTVVVSEGTYAETIDFKGKAVTLRSTDPDDWDVVAATVIDANSSGSVVTFDASEDANSVISGFTLTNGYGDANSGYYAGSGVFCSGSSPMITNCLIVDNGAKQADVDGGGIACYNGASPQLTNCIIANNAAQYSGGISCWASNPTFTSCLVADNSADYGGGIYCYGGGDAALINCTISKNAATYNGGGIYNYTSDPNIVNSILWGNSAGTSGDEIFKYSGDPNFRYCDANGCGGSGGGWNPGFGTDGGGNIDGDPCFTDQNTPAGSDDTFGTWDDGLRLGLGSPCIDAADGDAALPADIVGLGRIDIADISNTGIGDPNYADIGAYESPVVWFVDDDANGVDDGTSWKDAFTDLQDALAKAENGHEIWVAAGTYKPTSDSNSSIAFEMVEGVSLYGGFAGTEISRHQRDWTSYIATLSGDIGQPNSTGDNSSHVVVGIDRAVLDGFTVTLGNADGSGTNSYGGGMYNNSASPKVSNCTFRDNKATYGGGMYNRGGSSPELSRCVFSENQANYHGGGMYNYLSSPKITNSILCDNSAVSYHGGGIYNYYNCSPDITNSTFSGNSAGYYGGAIRNYFYSSPKVTNCILWGNQAGNSGGEIYNSMSSDPNFRHCDIEGGLNGSKCGGDPSTDGGGNIYGDPVFAESNDAAGPDDVFATWDDGLRITIDSNCIDAADGDAAPWLDLPGAPRVDVVGVGNTGTGDPNYADIGAYESYGRIDLDVDTNRDNDVNDVDDANEETVAAITLPNCDDDANSGTPDNWPGAYNRYQHPGLPMGDWNLNSLYDPNDPNEYPNKRVDDGNDINDLAPLWVHKTGLSAFPDDLKITLKVEKVSGEDGFFADVNAQERMRIFLPTKASGDNLLIDVNDLSIIGPEDSDTFEFVKTDDPNDANNYSKFLGSGIVKFGVEGIEFGAGVDVSVTVEVGGLIIGLDKARMRVAPFVLSNHSFAVDVTGDFDKTAYVTDSGDYNNDLRTKLSSKYGSRLDQPTGDPWQQDGYEVGSVKAPYGSMPVFLASPRGGRSGYCLAKYVHNQRLSPDVGTCWRLEGIVSFTTFDSFGNVECKPPISGPGSFFYGQSLHNTIEDFFAAQDVNPALPVNTNWLQVGHVDEVTSFAPDSNHCVVADPEVSWALLTWIDDVNHDAMILTGTRSRVTGSYWKPVYTCLESGMRSFNFDYVTTESCLFSILNNPNLNLDDPPETKPVYEPNNPGVDPNTVVLTKAGAFVGFFPNDNKREYQLIFDQGGSTAYSVKYREPNGTWATDPNVGSVNEDSIFTEAKCFILMHWWDDTNTPDVNDKFTFEADPTSERIEMPILFDGVPGRARAYVANHVNCLVDANTVFTGNVYCTEDLYMDYVEQMFERAGYSTVTDANSHCYLVGHGDIHCGTNAQRTLPTDKWWESD